MGKLYFLINILLFSLISCTKTDIPAPINNSIINPIDNFTGYKVSSDAYQLGESYWLRGTPILTDFFTYAFQTPFPGTNHIYQAVSVALGDFNKDGYLDMFNPGAAFQGPVVGFSFLVWNPITKVFDNKNLFNDKTFNNFGGNKSKTIPVDLNRDGYMDFVIFDNGDEYYSQASKNEPIRIVLSDGNGGYDLKDIETFENDTYTSTDGSIKKMPWKKEGGDVGDLNGDGYPDLVINCNNANYIYWGIGVFPFFTKTNRAVFIADNENWGSIGNNSFGENCSMCANMTFNSLIDDVNNDGQNDIIMSCAEDPNNKVSFNAPIVATHQRILINQGKGRFTNSSVITLPDYKLYNSNSQTQDYIVDDLNGDGLKDLIGLNSQGTSSWDIFTYIQQSNGSFVANYDIIKSNGKPKMDWKPRLLYADFNGDGKKDIGYIDSGFGMVQYKNSALPQKTIYIRTGGQFIEQDFFQFDLYAKSILPILK